MSLFINILHPNYFCEKIEFQIIKFYNSLIDSYVFYTINDLLTFPSFFRIILVFFYLCKNLEKNSSKADRVW